LRTAVLDASQQIIAEGHHIDGLIRGIAIEDGNVLMIAVDLQHGHTAVEQLLITEIVTLDVDLAVGTGHFAQMTTGRLRHHQILLAALGVHSIKGFVKSAQVESARGGGVLDVLAGGGGDPVSQTIELSGATVGIAVDEQSLEGQAHCAGLGLDLISASLGALQINDGAVNLDVTTEQLQRFALLLDGGIAFGIAIVESTEAHVTEGLFTLPEQTVALNFTEGQVLEQGTSGELGDDRQFLGIG